MKRQDLNCKSRHNSLTISQLTEHYKKKQRFNDEKFNKSYVKDFHCRSLKRPHLLKLPKIVQEQASILPIATEKRPDASKNDNNTQSGVELPLIKPINRKKSTTNNNEYHTDKNFLFGFNKDINNIKPSDDSVQTENPILGKEEIEEKQLETTRESIGIEKRSDCQNKSLDSLKIPTAAKESITNDGPKRISCNEYAKNMMLRKKKSWKDRRKEAKLFDINLLNPRRAMLTSSATARGLKVLKANEVIIYRFCLSNYSDVDISTVVE